MSNPPLTRSVPHAILLAAACSLLACEAVDEPAPAPEGAPRSSQPQQPIIDHGDGTYEYALPPNVDLSPRWAGPFLLEYEGQVQFAWDESAWPQSLLVFDDGVELDAIDLALELTLDDEHGSEWRVIDFDAQAWTALVDHYDATVEGQYGTEDFALEDPAPGQPGVYEVHPFTWTETRNCDTDNDVDQSVWDTEDRSPFFSPPTARMAKTVVLFRDVSENDTPQFQVVAGCSGVLVDDRVLLTAAHCVVDEDNTPHPLDRFVACTQGNQDVGAQCSTVRSRARPSRINPVSDSDWALLGLRTPIGTNNSMPLSRASAPVVEAQSAFNAGYPSHVSNGCNNNPPFANGTVAAFPQRQGFWHSTPEVDLTNRLTRTKLDGAKGQSGSPIYYYPGGCCGAHFVTGVLAGYRGGSPLSLNDGWVLGPRISPIRRTLIGLFPVL